MFSIHNKYILNQLQVYLILFILQLLVVTSYAQENKESKIQFGIESNIGMSYRFLKGKLDPQYELFNIFLESEIATSALEIGLLLNFPIKNNFSFKTGIKYVEWGVNTKKIQPFVNAEYQDFSIKDKTAYVEIPLNFRFYKKIKKDRIYINLGYSPLFHLYTNQIATLYYPNREETRKEKDEVREFRKINLVAEFGIGYEKKITEKIIVSISPNLKIQTLNFLNSDETIIKRKLYFYGISFSIMK